MKLQKPGNAPGPGPEVKKKELLKSKQRRVYSWTVQNEMRGVPGQMIAGAA